MIDYKYSDIIRGITVGDFHANDLLDFKASVSIKTGEIAPMDNANRPKGYQPRRELQAIYRQNKFIITNDRYIKHSGSLHEYFTDGGNFTDFTLPNLFGVIRDLRDKFDINPHNDVIHNIEFGVNVELPFKTKSFLDAVISYRGKEYERRTFSGGGHMIKFVMESKYHEPGKRPKVSYEFKLYDKGRQYNLSGNVLRVEAKVRTMNFLHSKKIPLRTSADLLNPTILRSMGCVLIDLFKLLVICPKIAEKGCNEKEIPLLKDGRNPKYWSGLKESNHQEYKDTLKRFRRLVLKYDASRMQETVGKLIRDKWNELSRITEAEALTMGSFLHELRPQTFPDLTANNQTKTFPDLTAYGPQSTTANFPQFNPSNSMLIRGNSDTAERRYCKTCGRDITDQKRGSVFCSETRYGAEAKRCRNVDSNPRNNFKSRERKIKSGGLLFEIDGYLTPLINTTGNKRMTAK